MKAQAYEVRAVGYRAGMPSAIHVSFSLICWFKSCGVFQKHMRPELSMPRFPTQSSFKDAEGNITKFSALGLHSQLIEADGIAISNRTCFRFT